MNHKIVARGSYLLNNQLTTSTTHNHPCRIPKWLRLFIKNKIINPNSKQVALRNKSLDLHGDLFQRKSMDDFDEWGLFSNRYTGQDISELISSLIQDAEHAKANQTYRSYRSWPYSKMTLQDSFSAHDSPLSLNLTAHCGEDQLLIPNQVTIVTNLFPAMSSQRFVIQKLEMHYLCRYRRQLSQKSSLSRRPGTIPQNNKLFSYPLRIS